VFVTYKPDGSAEPTRWDFKPGRIRAVQSALLEKLFSKLSGEKQTYEQFKAAVQQGSSAARRVLLWHLQSLDHPTLRIEDVDYAEDELLVEFSRGELEDMRETIAKVKGVDEEQRSLMLGAIDTQIESAQEDGGGKARLTTSASGTGSTSPPTSTSDPEPSTT